MCRHVCRHALFILFSKVSRVFDLVAFVFLLLHNIMIPRHACILYMHVMHNITVQSHDINTRYKLFIIIIILAIEHNIL